MPRSASDMPGNRDLVVLAVALAAAALCMVFVLASGTVSNLKATPVADPLLEYAWGIAYAVAFCAVTLALPLGIRDRLAVATVWCAKIAVALAAMLYYESFYVVLDAFTYYEVPRSADFRPAAPDLGQGTENLYSLVWLLYRVTPESYHALKVVFAFIGLLAVVLFYRAAVAFLGREDVRILYLLALFPSMLFWSSILGKEPVVLLGIGLYAYGTVHWSQSRRWSAALYAAAGIAIAMYVRVWLAPILIAPLVVLYLMSSRSILAGLAVVASLGVALVMSLAPLWEQFAVETTQDLLLAIDATSQRWAVGGSALLLDADLTQPGELIAALPLAAFTALFRPLPGEVQHLFGAIAGVENMLLLCLLVLALKRVRLADLRQPLVAWALAFVALWTLTYALVSYQNLGAAVRFRLQVLPFLLGLLAYLAARYRSRQVA